MSASLETVERVVPVELDESSATHRRPPKRQQHPYQRVLACMAAMRRLGAVVDHGYGETGRLITMEGVRPEGSFSVQFHCPGDRYCVEIQLQVGAVTDEERVRIGETCSNATNLNTFSMLFDLLAIRSECPTFDPSDTQGVCDALDCIFGPA